MHILAVKPNQTHLLSLREKRNSFYRSSGLSSALAFEPVIPVSVSTIEADRAYTASEDTPYRKELFIGFSRGGKGDSGRKKRRGEITDAPPVLSFASLERYRDTYYYPLTSSRIWEIFNDVLEEEHGAVDPSAPSALPVPPFPFIPPFPGIFVAAAEEGAEDGDRGEIEEAGPERTGPAFDKGPESDKNPAFDKTASSPEPWRNYKLALFELQGQIGNNGKWWDGCSWREVWELTLGGFS